MYTHIYIYIYLHVYTYMYIYKHMCIYTHICVYLIVCITYYVTPHGHHHANPMVMTISTTPRQWSSPYQAHGLNHTYKPQAMVITIPSIWSCVCHPRHFCDGRSRTVSW